MENKTANNINITFFILYNVS